MKILWILVLVLLMLSTVVGAKTEYYAMENNTGLNFMNGYYLIEVVKVSGADTFATVNLTCEGRSSNYNLWDGQSASINTAPWNKLQINGSFFTANGFRMEIEYPDAWSAPVKYTISTSAPAAVESSKVPNLVVTKSVDKTNINIGDVAEIKIKVENTGNGTANNLTLTEYLPDGFTRAAGSRFPPVVKEKLEPGTSDEIFYALEAVKEGTFTIEPTKLEYGSEKKESNSITITVVKEKSNLTASISLDKTELMTGDLINVIVKVTNDGNASAELVHLDGSVPEGLELEKGVLRKDYDKIGSGETESYSAIFKAVKEGNYQINLKTSYNDDTKGFTINSESISVTNKEIIPAAYLYIIIPVIVVIIGVILFTLRRHREYSY